MSYNKNPTVENNLLNLLRNRDDLKKWLLATGEYGNVFCNWNPINVTFHDMKKFDHVNPVIGKPASQVQANKLPDYQLTKKLLQQGEIDELQWHLDKLKYGKPKDDDEGGSGGRGGGGGGGDGGMPSLPP